MSRSRLRMDVSPLRGRDRGRPGLRAILAGLRYAWGRRDLLGSYLADLAAMTLAYPNALIPFIAAGLHASWATGLLFAAASGGLLCMATVGVVCLALPTFWRVSGRDRAEVTPATAALPR